MILLKGKIYLDNMPSPQVHYKSNSSDMDFKMHVSSAVITELAPLILFLKYSKYNENIINGRTRNITASFFTAAINKSIYKNS